MTGVPLLTLADVAAQLGLTVRQVRRLRSGNDPLPVFHLSRKAPRIHPDDLAAWLTRRRLIASISSTYTRDHDRLGAAEAANGGGALATSARGTPGGALEHAGAVGAGRTAHPRGGRPLNSQRLRSRAQTAP